MGVREGLEDTGNSVGRTRRQKENGRKDQKTKKKGKGNTRRQRKK